MIYFMVIGWTYALGSLIGHSRIHARLSLWVGSAVGAPTQGRFFILWHREVERSIAKQWTPWVNIVAIDPLDDPSDLWPRTLSLEVPSINADARDPLVLRMAGLGISTAGVCSRWPGMTASTWRW